MRRSDLDTGDMTWPSYAELSVCWAQHSIDPEGVGNSLTAMQVEAMSLSRRALLTVYLASCCFELGEIDAAINFLSASRQWNPLRLGARIDWLRRFCEAKLLVCRQDPAAVPALETLSRFPANQLEKVDLVFCHDWLARSLYQQGNLCGALKAAYIALDCAQQAQAKASLGDIGCRLGLWFAQHYQSMEAVTWLRQGLSHLQTISTGRNTLTYQLALADALLQTQQPSEALLVLHACLLDRPPSHGSQISRAQAWLMAAEAHSQLGQPEQAEPWLQKATMLRATSMAFRHRRDMGKAELALLKGDARRSLHILKRCATNETQPIHTISRFHDLMARSLAMTGEWHAACLHRERQLQSAHAQHQQIRTLLQADMAARADCAAIRHEQAIVAVRGMVSLEHDREWHRFLARLSRLHIGSEFSAGVIHEMKQPLAAMLSYSQAGLRLLQHQAEPDDVAGVLSRIQDTARHATQLVERLRAFLAREPQVASVFNLNNCAQDVISWLRPTCEEANIRIRTWLSDDLPDAWGNPVLVQQVIVNLLRNAYEALADHDADERVIVVETYCHEKRHICCRISDSGPGIDEARLPRLFEPFHTTKTGGMGLGLKISRAVLGEIGGDLHVENALIGASIVVSIPLSHTPDEVVTL
ncbi:ATP-binding protein [Chitinivorax sp. B]|uniref:ATP-binding protein n=1 Tax=Chitinivorax sp. B TaxID=2502235 RepID=UPI0010F995B6|nr:ATP-binding protein [Chitinivorax sp. B]